MKYLLCCLIVLSVFVGSGVYAQEANFYTDARDQKQLVGNFDRGELQKEPFNDWYNRFYKQHPKLEQLGKSLKKNIKKLNVEVYLGTWCGDSKRWVPEFMKLMDDLNVKDEQIEMIALYGNGDHYKQGNLGQEIGKNVHRVPTFIFYEDNEEVGRIVERPLNDMATDVAQIVSGIPSKPNYRIAHLLYQLFETMGPEKAYQEIEKYPRYWKRESRTDGELNTMGYVFMAAKEYEKAIAAFKTNILFYPEEPNCYDSLGEAYWKIGDKENAISLYKKVLELKPDDEHALEQLKEIEST